MRSLLVASLSVTGLLVGCASDRGVVTDQITEHQGKISAQGGPLRVGEEIKFLAQTCRDRRIGTRFLAGETMRTCSDYPIGVGKVIKILSPSEGVVEGLDSIVISKGMEFERRESQN